jgi:hypothetical protein
MIVCGKIAEEEDFRIVKKKTCLVHPDRSF